jgi:hypothetical protein
MDNLERPSGCTKHGSEILVATAGFSCDTIPRMKETKVALLGAGFIGD